VPGLIAGGFAMGFGIGNRLIGENCGRSKTDGISKILLQKKRERLFCDHTMRRIGDGKEF